MRTDIFRNFSRFSHYGVLHREVVKNDAEGIRIMLRKGLAQKVYRQGRVFYELTERAIPLLEQYRRKLLAEAEMAAQFSPTAYRPLLDDVRFLDEHSRAAKEFLFLGDWQLTRRVVPGQLALAKLRYYENHVAPRVRRGS